MNTKLQQWTSKSDRNEIHWTTEQTWNDNTYIVTISTKLLDEYKVPKGEINADIKKLMNAENTWQKQQKLTNQRENTTERREKATTQRDTLMRDWMRKKKNIPRAKTLRPIAVWIVANNEGNVLSAHCLGYKVGIAETDIDLL